MLGLRLVLDWKVRASTPEGCSPLAVLEGCVEGSFGQESLTQGVNIPLCYDLVTR